MYYYHQIENRLYVFIEQPTAPLPTQTSNIQTDFGRYAVYDTNIVPVNSIIYGASGKIGPDSAWDNQDLDCLIEADKEMKPNGNNRFSDFNGIIDLTTRLKSTGFETIVTFKDRVEVFNASLLNEKNPTTMDRKTLKDGNIVYIYDTIDVAGYNGDISDFFPIAMNKDD